MNDRQGFSCGNATPRPSPPASAVFTSISDEVEQALAEMPPVSVGLLHVQLLHTSASLTLNENADPDVRHDMDAFLRRLVPGNLPYFRHTPRR